MTAPAGNISSAVETTPVKSAALLTALKRARYNPADVYPERQWAMKGLFGMGTTNVWIGPEKARKSCLATRYALHVAAGKSVDNFLISKPRRVVYFSAEDPSVDLDERFNAMVSQFSPEEHELIDSNFTLIKGREELVNSGLDIEVKNETFWRAFRKVYSGEVYFLDALEMFHSGRSNEELRDAILKLRRYCGPQNCITVLHHTRKRSDYEIGQKKPVLLRKVGPRLWSDKCLGGGAIKRLADTIVCQEFVQEKNKEDSIIDETTDFATFGKSIEDVALQFKDDGLFHYKLVRDLSEAASESRSVLVGKRGPWPSRNAAAMELGLSRSQANLHIRELVQKGWLLVDEGGGVRLA